MITSQVEQAYDQQQQQRGTATAAGYQGGTPGDWSVPAGLQAYTEPNLNTTQTTFRADATFHYALPTNRAEREATGDSLGKQLEQSMRAAVGTSSASAGLAMAAGSAAAADTSGLSER